jgi:hypothetical protein
MIDRLITEIKQCMEYDLLLPALALALTLPDTCGKAEYPQEKSTKTRFTDWYNKHVCAAWKPLRLNENGPNMSYLSGEMAYNLRCQYLHQSTPNIDFSKKEFEKNQVDSFRLVLTRKDNLFAPHDAAFMMLTPDAQDETAQIPIYAEYEINVRWLCESICTAAEKYYRENKSCFNFLQYEIVDYDSEENQPPPPLSKEIEKAYLELSRKINQELQN